MPDTPGLILVVVGMLALLVGVTAVLPWALERLTRVSAGCGPLSWQLAVRRLQLSSEASTRSVNGIVIAVAGYSTADPLQWYRTGSGRQPPGGEQQLLIRHPRRRRPS
ncbi:hypothetical protein ACIPSA_29595 [Streptomyces sp. NPDC086549]|uniref:hypothetical protein n=1 Tax=Streptomyces sp. NPDC086549 TaxID=3365752 RepID=UPI00382614CF